MPELPEVERGRKVAELVAVDRRVVRARCADDRIVFCDQAPRTVANRLRDRTVLAAGVTGSNSGLNSIAGLPCCFISE